MRNLIKEIHLLEAEASRGLRDLMYTIDMCEIDQSR